MKTPTSIITLAALFLCASSASAQTGKNAGVKKKPAAKRMAPKAEIFSTAALDPNCQDSTRSALASAPPSQRRNVPITVRAHSGKKVTVIARGAPARQVLFEISKNAEIPIWIHGPYTQSPIWTALTKVNASEAIHAVAMSIGHVTMNEKHGVHILPSDTAKAWHAQTQPIPATGKLERWVLKSPMPTLTARGLARLVLSCQGKAIALPASNTVVVEDFPRSKKHIDTFLKALKAPPAQQETLDVTTRRSPAAGWFPIPPCQPAATNEKGGASDPSAKTLFLAAAKAKKNLVLGCAGSTPATLANTKSLKWNDLLTRTDFLALGSNPSSAVPPQQGLKVRLSPPQGPWVVTERAVVVALQKAQTAMLRQEAGNGAKVRFLRSMKAGALTDSINALGLAQAVALPKAKVVAIRILSDEDWSAIQRLSASLNQR
jgi:hypothetical protein